MENIYVENRIIDFPLPEFLTSFVDKINAFIIPILTQLIEQLQANQHNNAFLNILSFLFLVFIIRSVTDNLFVFRAPPIKQCSQPQVDTQLSLLSSEIGNLKNSLKKVIQRINMGQGSEKNDAEQKNNLIKLMNCYKKTVDDFNSLANFIIDSQQSVFQEVKSFKKNYHKSSQIKAEPKDLEIINHQQTNSSQTQQTLQQARILPVKTSKLGAPKVGIKAKSFVPPPRKLK